MVSILLGLQLRVSTQSSFFRKPQSNASPLAERTFQLNLRMMQRRTMLDNRKPQSGAAGHLAVAFIHAVEPLKHALLIRRRDTDAGIRHLHERSPALRASRKRHAALRLIIIDGVIRQIEDHLLERAALTGNRSRFSLDAQCDALACCLALQAVAHGITEGG